MNNPLFPSAEDEDKGHLLPKKRQAIQPAEAKSANPAAEIIRHKLDKIYAREPDAKKEMNESEQAGQRSKHQQFMHELSTSGKSLADIQTEWHNYYVGLPNREKHEVWQEFYDANARTSRHSQAAPLAAAAHRANQDEKDGVVSRTLTLVDPTPLKKPRRPAAVKKQILDTVSQRVSAGGRLKAKHHLQSLAFGLGMGCLVLFIFLFGFFNEFFIAPFIQPGHASATPLIIGTAGLDAADKPDEVIIPKINLEIPVDYSETSTNEATIENDLENGVVHYPTTELPGQRGNAAFFGHSSNNIFNPGHYKFAFVLLHTLVPGDSFYLIKNHNVYVYKVISKTIVDPNDVSVLNDVPGQVATATLITCDPPGTSLHRLVVVGQQIQPDPATDAPGSVPSAAVSAAPAKQLPGNGPSLFTRMWRSIF